MAEIPKGQTGDARTTHGLTGLIRPWDPTRTRPLPVAGSSGTNVPTGVTDLVASDTVIGGSTGSFVTVYPDGVARPNSSKLDFWPGRTIANLVTARIGSNGVNGIYSAIRKVDLVSDVVGCYAAT